MAKRTNRVAWGLAAGLAAVVLGGIGLLGVRLRPYWVAKYRGAGADLQRAVLVYAPLAGVDLGSACLRDADLASANLRDAFLRRANLQRTRLCGANLQGADLENAILDQTDFSGANLCAADLSLAAIVRVNLRGTIYNSDTAWPYGLNPVRLGAILVK
jgi:uncharacterized protein YjbI with pentapeptide repeats